MSDMKVGQGTTFQDIHSNFKQAGISDSKHLRFSESKGLYTHSKWKLSGFGKNAMQAREQKWQNAATQVKTAVAQQYGDRFANELFQRLDIKGSITGLDLDRIKRATARFEDAVGKGHAQENLHFNSAIATLDKIDPQEQTQAYKNQIKLILRDHGRSTSKFEVNLESRLQKRLRNLTDSDVDRMSVADLKLLRQATLEPAKKETTGLVDDFQIRTGYWKDRQPDFETMYENTGIQPRAQGIDFTQAPLEQPDEQQPISGPMDTSAPITIRRTKTSEEFRVYVQDRLNMNVTDDLGKPNKFTNGIHDSAIADFGRTNVTIDNKVMSTVGDGDEEALLISDKAQEDLAEHLDENERRVITSLAHQAVFEPFQKAVMDLDHYRPMPFLPEDIAQAKDPKANQVNWEITRTSKDHFRFKATVDKQMQGLLDLQSDMPTHVGSDPERSNYRFELSGTIDVSNHDNPIRIPNPPYITVNHIPSD